ncbi:hypothetical protein C8R44DRAFT_878359 [Mycena epipterygia]|nr:hypothetical protein C8R44DRAFT_878359 [Mycena epipterygia]
MWELHNATHTSKDDRQDHANEDNATNTSKNAARQAARHQAAIENPDLIKRQRQENGLARSTVGTIQLLATAAHNPTTWDITPFLANGTLVLSPKDGPPPQDVCQNYICRLKICDTCKSLTSYLCTHPADTPNTILQLLLHGAEPSEIRTHFTTAMLEFGLEAAAEALMDMVEATVIELIGAGFADSEAWFPYAGISWTVACSRHCWDDVATGANVCIINFLEVNTNVTWQTFHLPELDMPILDSLDVHTSLVSNKEQIMCAVLGTCTMNSAHGGVKPISLPSPEKDRDPALEEDVCKIIDAEAVLLAPMHAVKIVPAALADVKKNAARSIRLVKGRVVTLHIAKDITFEGITRRCGGYWDATSTATSLSTLSPTILAHWLTSGGLILSTIQPLVIMIQSGPATATLLSGDLVECWSHLTAADASLVLRGNLPSRLLNILPTNVPYRNFCGSDFNEHSGSQVEHWELDYCVVIVNESTIRITAYRLKNIPCDWSDAERVKTWLKAVKDQAEKVLEASGVAAALETAKKMARDTKLVLNFLRAMIASKRLHDTWVAGPVGKARPQRSGVKTAPANECCAQLHQILEQAHKLNSFDLPPDPNHYGCYKHPILSDSFSVRFMSLPAGKDIVYVANALGQTKASHEASKANFAHFIDWCLKNPPDLVAIKHQNLVKTIKEATHGNDFMMVALSDPLEVLKELDLHAVSIVSILSPTQQAELWKALTRADFNALMSCCIPDSYVFVSTDQLEDNELLLTLAIDVVLGSSSTCPTLFLPRNPEGRVVWSEKKSALLIEWFHSATRSQQLYMVACHRPPGVQTRAAIMSTLVDDHVLHAGQKVALIDASKR